jgi:hypothetical protein
MAQLNFSYLVSTTHTMRLDVLQNVLTPGFVNTATVTLESLVDATTGGVVSGQTFPLALNYVPASNGVYQATLEPDLDVVIGQRLRGTILANAGGGVQRRWVAHILVEAG